MDARTVLTTWLDETNPDRRGKQGRLLQGTSTERYAEHVTNWLDFIEDTVHIGAWRAQPSHVVTWLDMKGGKVRTRALRVSAVGAFYAYAIQFGHAVATPVHPKMGTGAWNAPRTERLAPGQMELIRWAADRLEGKTPERDRLLMYLMLAGLRSRQIIELTVQDLAFEQHRLVATVWQKGGGTRPLAFPDEVRAAVKAYLPVRTHRPPQSFEDRGPLLVSRVSSRGGQGGNRLDSNTTPRTILHATVLVALACPDPDAPELPPGIKPDMVALSPSPFGELERA
ncbi:tyrosine-type recombinase/integrase (plasmid) [Streptomyces sp. RLB1-9]|uniref:tyrosine-type recombinase/integrase n=1 Tax=Streptomyces sp. RLB1-9 TaxID=2594454 RepID=UPI0011653149|nr:tyrosine-type recombinase/integrase [Streptomyces sp. RLB1-9]QDN94913.1 tyrosine-type recombinase/integrase [Streptomyces sp. RLB1-9]